MTPHGDTATHASLPFLGRVVFVAVVALSFIILGATAARALDLGGAVEKTTEEVETVAEPVEKEAAVVEMVAEPTPKAGTDTAKKVVKPVEESADVAAVSDHTPDDVVREPTPKAGTDTAKKVVEPVEEAVEETVARVEETVDTVDEPAEDVIADVSRDVVEPAEDVTTGLSENVVKPVEEVVGETVAQVEETAGAAGEAVEDLATQATTTVIEPVEDVVSETVAEIEDTATTVVGTTTELVTDTTLRETTDTVVETTTELLLTTVDSAADGEASTVAETDGTPAKDAKTAKESPEISSTSVDQDAAWRPTSQLPPDPSWTPSPAPGHYPSPTAAHVAAPDPAPDEVTNSPHVAQGSTFHDAPDPVAPPATAIANAIALAGSSSPSAGPIIVFLSAALLLMGHIAPRLTEWLRLRPLIWRDEGLALAIERPG